MTKKPITQEMMAAGPAIEDASHAQITNLILLMNQDQGGQVEKGLSYYF